MRPVQKAQLNDVLNTQDGNITVKASYSPHTSARLPLEANLGSYCSYCEVFSSDLEVEHIISQDQDSTLKHTWSNFLLACGTCNGGGNKSNNTVDLNGMYFPHQHNTFLAFQYLEGGVVRLHPNLTQAQKTKAEATLNLLGLDKYPNNPKYPRLNRNDVRWKHRRTAWELADKYRKMWERQETTLPTIIDLAISKGFFSVWFTVFGAHKGVQKALVEAFIGTATACFDAQQNPINRNNNDI